MTDDEMIQFGYSHWSKGLRDGLEMGAQSVERVAKDERIPDDVRELLRAIMREIRLKAAASELEYEERANREIAEEERSESSDGPEQVGERGERP